MPDGKNMSNHKIKIFANAKNSSLFQQFSQIVLSLAVDFSQLEFEKNAFIAVFRRAAFPLGSNLIQGYQFCTQSIMCVPNGIFERPRPPRIYAKLGGPHAFCPPRHSSLC